MHKLLFATGLMAAVATSLSPAKADGHHRGHHGGYSHRHGHHGGFGHARPCCSVGAIAAGAVAGLAIGAAVAPRPTAYVYAPARVVYAPPPVVYVQRPYYHYPY